MRRHPTGLVALLLVAAAASVGCGRLGFGDKPDPPEFRLDVAKIGDGTGAVEAEIDGTVNACEPVCNFVFSSATAVILRATADPNSTFDVWDSVCAQAAGACQFVVSGTDVAVNAAFTFEFAPGDVIWWQQLGGVSDDAGYDAAVDPTDNAPVMTGSYQGAVDFGGGPLRTAGGDEVLFAKFQRDDGTHDLSRGFEGNSNDEGRGIAVDDNGKFYLTGIFRQTLRIDGDTTYDAGMGGAETDSFLIRFGEDDGIEIDWSRQLDAQQVDLSNAVEVDANTVAVGGSAQTAFEEIVMRRYTSDDPDAFTELALSSGTTADGVLDVAATAAGDFVYVGFYGGSLDTGATTLPNGGGSNAFLSVRSPQDLSEVTAAGFASNGNEEITAVASDDVNGGFFVAGFYEQPIDLGGGNLPAPSGTSDVFVARFDAAGQYDWHRVYGGSANDRIWGLATDADKGLVLVGEFEGDFLADGNTVTGVADGNSDMMAFKVSPTNGDVLWIVDFSGPGHDVLYGVDVDAGGNAYATGAFNETIDVVGNVLDASTRGQDILLVRLAR